MSVVDSREQGSVIVITLIVAMLLTGLGIAALYSSGTGTQMSTSVTRRQEAYAAARSGLDHARAILSTRIPMWGDILGGVACTAGTVDYEAADTAQGKPEKGRVLCVGADKFEDVALREGLGGGELQEMDQVQYTLFVRNDPVEGGANADNDQRIVIRSEGRGRDGISYVALEATLLSLAGGGIQNNYNGQIGGGPQGSNSAEANIPDA